jgi:nucleoside-diphosphate kinase
VIERTLAIVKPDAVTNNYIGEMIRRFEAASLKVVALKMKTLSKEEAKIFYGVHSARPFFDGLIAFICSGPVVPMVLEGEGAVLKVRALMGATDPKKADKGTIRHDLGAHIEANAVHGSDSPETAGFEIPLFFPELI